MRHAFYKQICLSFLKLRARGAITYAIVLTPEAAEQEFNVKVDSGRRLPQARINAQAHRQTAVEDLDVEISADWNGRLTTAQIAGKKKSSPEYAARLDQLLNEGILK
jgi:hypothetical protein